MRGVDGARAEPRDRSDRSAAVAAAVRLIGLDTDNDSVFMNQSLISYCGPQGIEQTRSRAYRKNDQAWIEQKNGAVVRKLVGYGRLEGLEAARTLGRLYEASRLYVNFFQPSMKLKSKTRTGAKVAKLYHPPATPCDRLLASDHVAEHAKEKLREQFVSLDPIALLQAIREAQTMLATLTNRSSVSPNSPVPSTGLTLFLESLGSAWRAGEVRATHRERVRAARTWRTRKDPFESAWPMLLDWIEADPSLTAKALFKAAISLFSPIPRVSTSNTSAACEDLETPQSPGAVVSSPGARTSHRLGRKQRSNDNKVKVTSVREAIRRPRELYGPVFRAKSASRKAAVPTMRAGVPCPSPCASYSASCTSIRLMCAKYPIRFGRCYRT